jgi:hypothetical protein
MRLVCQIITFYCICYLSALMPVYWSTCLHDVCSSVLLYLLDCSFSVNPLIYPSASLLAWLFICCLLCCLHEEENREKPAKSRAAGGVGSTVPAPGHSSSRWVRDRNITQVHTAQHWEGEENKTKVLRPTWRWCEKLVILRHNILSRLLQ